MESSGASIDWIVLADLVPGREPSSRAADVDKDSLGDFLKACGPSVQIAGRTLAFREFKDFRPERLARELPDAAALLEIRRQALDLAAGKGPAESLRDGLRRLTAHPELAAALEETPEAPAPQKAPSPPSAAPPAAGGIFDLVDTEGGKPPAPETGLKGLLDEILGKGPAAAGPSSAALRKLAARAEDALGGVLRSTLHDPAFRRLEASWRGLRYFVRSLDFRAGCKLRVLPVPAGRLLGAVKEVALPLAEESRSEGRLAALLLDFALEPSEETVGLARAAAARSVPVLASAAATSDPAWEAFRSLEAARWLPLAANGFLLRAPYGKEGDPVRDFPFEESGEPGPWGRPAWLLGALVSAAVVRTGWGVDFAGREAAEALESIPGPMQEELGEPAARALAEAGFLPLACRRNDGRPFAAGGGALREALFASQVSAKVESLLPHVDPSRGLEEIARTLGAGLELLAYPDLAVDASAAEDPPRARLRVRPAGPRLRGLPGLDFEVPIPLR